jgi:hypothetical protein
LQSQVSQDDDWLDYNNELRIGILEGYSGILQGLSTGEISLNANCHDAWLSKGRVLRHTPALAKLHPACELKHSSAQGLYASNSLSEQADTTNLSMCGPKLHELTAAMLWLCVAPICTS